MTPSLTPEMQAELAKLRDIRLPDAVSWWPLAPGWWLLAAACLSLVFGIWAYAILRRRTVRYVALRELERLRERADQEASPSFATEIGVLLRRVAIKLQGKAKGLLAGPDWAAFLTEGKGGIDPALAGYLADAPYAAPELPDDQAPSSARLVAAAERWIRRQS